MLKRNHLVRNGMVQYQQPDKLIINESTYRRLEDYLSDGFLEKIEIFLEQ